MFTGIIEGLGTITGIQPSNQGKKLSIEADFSLNETKIGDSIAVSGACLTAVTLDNKNFQVDVAPETLSKSTLGDSRVGERVNLERALQLSGRLDGHLVSGHVDGVGTIKSKENKGNAIIITINIPESLANYMIKKGSVAVDGISLTINNCDNNSFEVRIIPHTAKLTTVGFKKAGDAVNIETDMIGKYVEKFVKRMAGSDKEDTRSSISKQFLEKTGFL